MYILGGCGDGLMVADNPSLHDGDLFCLDLIHWTWSLVSTSGAIPPPLYSHTCTMINDNHMMVVGGSSGGKLLAARYTSTMPTMCVLLTL
jgi:hypothetical protein